jgi:WD40 repeat protein
VWPVSGEEERILRCHPNPVQTVAFSRDGEHIVSQSRELVQIWSNSGEPNAIHRPTSTVDIRSMAFSPNGQCIASGFSGGVVRLLFVSGERERILKGHRDHVNSIAFSPDSQYIVSGSNDGTVRVWSVSGKPERVFRGHTGSIYSVAFSPDGRSIVSGSEDRTTRVWSVSGEQKGIINRHGSRVDSIIFSEDGQHIASQSCYYDVRVWSVSGEHKQILSESIPLVGFSNDGRWVILQNLRGYKRAWSMSTGTRAKRVKQIKHGNIAISGDKVCIPIMYEVTHD